jgi:effector-binding domain-containing protein
MKIKRAPLIFHHVLSSTVKAFPEEWDLIARDFRNAIIKNGLYTTGPIFYQVPDFTTDANDVPMKFTFFAPVNEAVQIPPNEKYQYHDVLEFKDGLVLRHADMDEEVEESYAALHACAEQNGLTLQEPFYNIYLDVFGGGIMDIYAPIIKEG